MTELTAVVLAGGFATRFWPITKNKPKVLLPMDGSTCVMDKVIDELSEDSRVSDIYISTNQRFEEDISDHLKNSNYDTPKISVEESTQEDEKLGVVGALSQFVDREDMEGENLLIVAGDNIMDMHVGDLIDKFESDRENYIVTYDIGSTKKASSYGVVRADDEREVQEFYEKPDNPTTTLVSTACYILKSESVRFQEYLDSESNPDEVGNYMAWLKNKDEMYTYSFSGKWYDIGTPESYIEAVQWWLNDENYVSESSEVHDGSVGESSIILGDCEIRNSEVSGSVVLGRGTLVDCNISDSVIDEGVSLQGVNVNDGYVGNEDS